MSEPEKKKIIIDEDWKAQVEREREELQNTSAVDSPAAGDAAAAEGQGLPEASITVLGWNLATQALAFLGQIPEMFDGKPVINLELARHHIDMLAVLEEKTAGNLTAEEQQVLEELLHNVRSTYLEIQRQIQSGQSGES